MPEFYNIYDDNCIDIYEGDSCEDYSAVDSFMVEDDLDDSLEDPDTLEVFEEEPDLAVDGPKVPGTETQYVQFNKDEGVEVREENWADDKDASQFLDYLKDKLTKIPRHSGNTVPGCERATAYVKDLDNQASKAMRSDYDGKIDEEELDQIRKDMQGMVDRLENHIDRLSKNASTQKVKFISEGYCKKCESSAPMWYDATRENSVCMSCEPEDGSDDLQKTAGTPMLKVYMTPFERACIGTMINAKVSAGRNIEEVYDKLKGKYNFTPREEFALQQLLMDHGYPMIKDRGLINELADPASGDGIDFQTNYHA